jgi:hypothetical protein
MTEDDFEFKNEMAEYFIDLQGRFLILDSGTGPDRGLEIWDIEAKKKTYTIQYSQPLSIRADAIEFWIEIGEGTSSNCPLYEKWAAQGFGTAIESRVILTLPGLDLMRTYENRCVTRQ